MRSGTVLTGDGDDFKACRAVFERRRVMIGDLTDGIRAEIAGSLARGFAPARDTAGRCAE